MRPSRYARDYRRFIGPIMSSLCHEPTRAEIRTWSDWVTKSSKTRDASDLYELIASEAKSVFKRIAIYILLCPDREFSQYKWVRSELTHGFYEFRSADIPSELMEFSAGLLKANIEFCLQNEAARDTLNNYNRTIVGMLARMDPESEMAEHLFRAFNLNDVVAWCGLEDSSGYNPFHRLMTSKAPEKWKILAIQEMQRIMQSEHEGSSKPRAEYEAAVDVCINFLGLDLYGFDTLGKKPPYSTDLLITQLEWFLENADIVGNRPIIRSFNMLGVILVLRLNGREDLAIRLMRQAIAAKSGFGVHDAATESAAREILKHLEEDDSLAKELRSHIDRFLEEHRHRTIHEQDDSRRDEALQQAMQ